MCFSKQKLLQFDLVRVEEMRARRWDVEQWMSNRMLPDSLRLQIRRHEEYKWQQTKGIEEDSFIQNLPRDLRRNLKRHLCWSLLYRVSTYRSHLQLSLSNFIMCCVEMVFYLVKKYEPEQSKNVAPSISLICDV